MYYTGETELFSELEQKLFTAVICDVLDDMGYRNQSMTTHIAPIGPDMVVIGRAKTVLAADVYTQPDKPYEMEIEALDSAGLNEVVVVATNHSTTNAFWGELLSTYAMIKKVRGAIVEGGSRDIRQIRQMGFKLFTSNINPLDSKGRCLVIDYDCEINCGGVLVKPQDLIFADYDGIVVIPKAVEKEVIERSLNKVSTESQFISDLKNGLSLQKAFERHGIL